MLYMWACCVYISTTILFSPYTEYWHSCQVLCTTDYLSYSGKEMRMCKKLKEALIFWRPTIIGKNSLTFSAQSYSRIPWVQTSVKGNTHTQQMIEGVLDGIFQCDSLPEKVAGLLSWKQMYVLLECYIPYSVTQLVFQNALLTWCWPNRFTACDNRFLCKYV